MGLKVYGLAADDALGDVMDVDQRPCRGVGCGLVLAGEVDEERGARVEFAAGGVVVLVGPGREPVPEVDAPGVVALDDEVGLIPARRSLEGLHDVAENDVDQREVVDVRAVAGGGVVGVGAAPDVGAVRDGEVQEDEVGLIGVEDRGG